MATTESTKQRDQTQDVFALRGDRQLDLVALRALAHPLRVQILDTLSTYGSFTASGLAERLGESSGATSYHLRQLEKHGFVREVEGKGTSRERWWERTPGGINVGSEEATGSAAGRSAATMIFRQMRYNQERMLTEFVERGPDELADEWLDGAVISTMNARLTPAQMSEFVAEVMKLADRYIVPNKNQNVPNSRPVVVNFQTFPVIDGDVVAERKNTKNP
jgi:DNA-binding transcriptional ArsR family regulator